MAVVADPAGAVFCLWEKKGHAGAETVNEHGALTWNELVTPDPSLVAPFYAEVLGWTTKVTSIPEGDYMAFVAEGADPNGIAGALASAGTSIRLGAVAHRPYTVRPCARSSIG